MLNSAKRPLFFVLTGFVLLFSFYFPKADSTNLSDDDQEPPSLVSPRESPVISTALSRLMAESSSEDSIKVWVFFTDKGVFSQRQYRLAKGTFRASLSGAALKRRSKNRVQVDFLDLPVNQSYVDRLLEVGGRLRHRSRWLNAISLQIRADKIDQIAEFPFVRRVKRVASYERKPLEVEPYHGPLLKQSDFEGYGRNYGPSLPQLDQINVPIVHDMGFMGQDVIVGMLDTGYRKDHQAFAAAFSEGRVLAEWDFIYDDGNTQNETGDPLAQHNHGTYCWSALGGEYDGKLYGPAYKASFVLAKTEDTRWEKPVEEDDWVAGLEWADSIGAEVASSSLAYMKWDTGGGYTYEDMDGNTAVTTQAADMAASRGIVVCNAMGNEGPAYHTLDAPADADSILACGAVDESGVIAGFSSRGPTYDGRIKPEVVARGVATYCALPYAIDDYGGVGGTSLATPLVGGCAAALISAHPDWTAMQAREALMMTANNASSPDSTYGWGLLNLFAALNYTPSGALAILHDPPLFSSDTLNPHVISATITPGNGLLEDSLFLIWHSDTLAPFVKAALQPLGSDQYEAEIPAQSAGTVVYYYLSAQDSFYNVVNYPLGAPRFRLKLFVATDFITFDFEDGFSLWQTGGTNNSWNWSSVSARSGDFGLTDSPLGSYQNYSDSWAELEESFDLSEVASPQLSFWHRYQFWLYDTGFVEINTNGGKGWERLAQFVEIDYDWSQVNLPLDAYSGQSEVRFRFHLVSDWTGAGDGWYIDDIRVNFSPTSVEEEPASVPTQFSLHQNYPNPFNPSTSIRYTVDSRQTSAPITLKVYNIRGQLVRVLVDGEVEPGNYQVVWDGRNDKGEDVSSGIYLYRLAAGERVSTRKMLLLK
jgi:serine protease AprX